MNLYESFRNKLNESDTYVVNKTPYGFTEVYYKGYSISNSNAQGGYNVNIGGDECYFDSFEEAKAEIDKLDADSDYHVDYPTDVCFNQLKDDYNKNGLDFEGKLFTTSSDEEVKKALNESVNADGVYEDPLTPEEHDIVYSDRAKFDKYVTNRQKKALQKASYRKLKSVRDSNIRGINYLYKDIPGFIPKGLTKEDFISDYKKNIEEVDAEINERINKLIDDFSKDPSNKELFNKTLNEISKLEYDGVINKDLYDDAIKRTQSVYVNKNKGKEN